MACHKTLKAGDTIYIGGIKINTTNKTSLSIEADKSIVIIHSSENRSGDYGIQTKTD